MLHGLRCWHLMRQQPIVWAREDFMWRKTAFNLCDKKTKQKKPPQHLRSHPTFALCSYERCHCPQKPQTWSGLFGVLLIHYITLTVMLEARWPLTHLYCSLMEGELVTTETRSHMTVCCVDWNSRRLTDLKPKTSLWQFTLNFVPEQRRYFGSNHYFFSLLKYANYFSWSPTCP